MLKLFTAMLLICCTLIQPTAFAQQTTTTDNWHSVSTRSAGEILRIRLKDRSTVSGTLTSFNDTALVVAQKNKELSLSREEIASVSVLRKKSARKAALIGMAVGGGAGAGAGAGLGAAQNGNLVVSRGQSSAIGAGVCSGLGAAAGALIGFALGRSGHKETVIYQALPAK